MTFHDDRHPGTTAQAAPPTRAASPAVSVVTNGSTAATSTPWEQCDRCQAPVDRTQRYCVACGTHQGRASDPVVRFFNAARRPKSVAAVVPVASSTRTVPVAVAAVLIALLPVAAGVGIIVGRGQNNSGDQVIEAIKVLQSSGGGTGAVAGGAGTVVAADGSTTAADDTASTKKAKSSTTDGVETSDKAAPVIASGPTGSARKLEGTKPTKKDIAESKKAVEEVNSRKGQAYIDTQKDLPDSIVIP